MLRLLDPRPHFGQRGCIDIVLRFYLFFQPCLNIQPNSRLGRKRSSLHLSGVKGKHFDPFSTLTPSGVTGSAVAANDGASNSLLLPLDSGSSHITCVISSPQGKATAHNSHIPTLKIPLFFLESSLWVRNITESF